ncbi:AAC(3) family N-acetyltransferase [Sphingopyxis terrae]|uniref:AAC(3) family N-acetyltransferase n=1 Tax=Sphingopyxis terrae TaxID=33052 RepID=UPI0007889C62|nr:AAC(3) family N-acetyltransferase [Sphingopyxis terrae]
MIGFAHRVLARIPLAEVAVRQLYWRVPLARRAAQKLASMKGGKAKAPPAPQPRLSLADLIELLGRLGIGADDMLIVHAGSIVVEATGETPRAINTALRALLGPKGTLAMPGFPTFRSEPSMADQIAGGAALPVHDYDPARTPLWTGLLAMDLLRTPGAVRSSFPINPLIAIGADVPAMFAAEWDAALPTACGGGSGWEYAVARGAKILMLGVDVAHSLTLNHHAEDAYPDSWPIAGWYRERIYRVRVDGTWSERRVLERDPRWALHYAERALNQAMTENGHMQQVTIGGLTVSLIDARAHIAFLNTQKSAAFPYFGISRRHRK